jgi:hypothetical protein
LTDVESFGHFSVEIGQMSCAIVFDSPFQRELLLRLASPRTCPSGVPAMTGSLSVSPASVTVRADGMAAFRLRFRTEIFYSAGRKRA